MAQVNSDGPLAAKTNPRPSAARILRKIGIGPRLILFALLPIVALLAVIALLAADDLRHVRDLNNYASNIAEVSELVGLRSAVQEERHQLVDPSIINTDFDSLDASFASPIEEALRMRSTIDVVQVLPEARRLRSEGGLVAAAQEYTAVVHEFDRIIAEQLSQAPLGQADVKAAAVIDLLTSHEAFLQEDLELFIGCLLYTSDAADE